MKKVFRIIRIPFVIATLPVLVPIFLVLLVWQAVIHFDELDDIQWQAIGEYFWPKI